ncbi:MAG: polyprenyl diphosphate synthase [Candidatus Nealsonbacteria bacterium]
MTSQTKNIPYHLGIIIDGNRRWAKERGLPTLIGHRKGLNRVKQVLGWAKNRGIKILTLFVFSTENWERSESEVNYLMRLLRQGLNDFKRNIKKINKDGIRIKIIGQKEKVPAGLHKIIHELEELTQNNKEMTVNIALSYGGRAEIASAIKNIIKKKISPDEITEKTISENLWTSDVDLLIRTGKEQRISNFLIWQSAYAELYFSEKYWPDFTEEDLDKALDDFAARNRRHGK